MKDPYVYTGTNILKNLADIRDAQSLAQMEADYALSRLSDIVINNFEGSFDFEHLCDMHFTIFQDVYEWAGKIRTINIEKEEPALGGISIEYSEWSAIEKEVSSILLEANVFEWEEQSFEEVTKYFSVLMGKLWKIHPFREGNTRACLKIN